MRLHKYMALCGIASRRQSEQIIDSGRVTVNGQIITVPGFQIDEDDIVCVDGKRIKEEAFEYYLLNKPKGIVSTSSDCHADRTVIDFIQTNSRLYTVGRLDKDTEGLIILTNDGDMTFKLTHPKYSFPKTYECLVKGIIDQKAVEQLSKGVEIETDEGVYLTQPAVVEIMKYKMGASVLHITISEGKKRQIRKMCAAVSHPVIQLKRIALGNLKDDHLKIGQWRKLTEKEIMYLKGLV